MRPGRWLGLSAIAAWWLPAPAAAISTAVQIASVDLATEVIEVRNFGGAPEPLDALSFCSHSDLGVVRQYTLPGLFPVVNAFEGVSLAPGGSIFVHLANDAPAQADHFDASELGVFAPLSNSGFALELYDFNGSLADFTSAARIRDHLQWSTDGTNLGVAVSVRGQLAVSAGLWTASTAWVATAPDTVRVELTDESGGTLHGPADYQVLPEPAAAAQSLGAAVALGAASHARRRWPLRRRRRARRRRAAETRLP